MGLKDLKSNLDLLGGFGNEGETLGGMETFNPNNFQKGIEDASHKLSLGISLLCSIFFSVLASYLFSKGYRIKT